MAPVLRSSKAAAASTRPTTKTASVIATRKVKRPSSSSLKRSPPIVKKIPVNAVGLAEVPNTPTTEVPQRPVMPVMAKAAISLTRLPLKLKPCPQYLNGKGHVYKLGSLGELEELELTVSLCSDSEKDVTEEEKKIDNNNTKNGENSEGEERKSSSEESDDETKPKKLQDRIRMAMKVRRLESPLRAECGTCDKIFKTRMALLAHQDKAGHRRQCKFCPLAFTSNSNYVRHLYFQHGKAKHWMCDECGHTFYPEPVDGHVCVKSVWAQQ